jgi:hypothetical protein
MTSIYPVPEELHGTSGLTDDAPWLTSTEDPLAFDCTTTSIAFSPVLPEIILYSISAFRPDPTTPSVWQARLPLEGGTAIQFGIGTESVAVINTNVLDGFDIPQDMSFASTVSVSAVATSGESVTVEFSRTVYLELWDLITNEADITVTSYDSDSDLLSSEPVHAGSFETIPYRSGGQVYFLFVPDGTSTKVYQGEPIGPFDPPDFEWHLIDDVPVAVEEFAELRVDLSIGFSYTDREPVEWWEHHPGVNVGSWARLGEHVPFTPDPDPDPEPEPFDPPVFVGQFWPRSRTWPPVEPV